MSNQVVECVSCGHVGATGTKGSTFIFLILLCCGFVPGVIYAVWRSSGGGVCSACKSSNVKLYIPKQRLQQVQLPPTPQGIDSLNVQQIQCPDCREYIRYDARKCKHCGSMVEQV